MSSVVRAVPKVQLLVEEEVREFWCHHSIIYIAAAIVCVSSHTKPLLGQGTNVKEWANEVHNVDE